MSDIRQALRMGIQAIEGCGHGKGKHCSCPLCHFVRQAYKALAEDVPTAVAEDVAIPKRLTPESLSAWRRARGLEVTQISKVFGFNRRTWQRMEKYKIRHQLLMAFALKEVDRQIKQAIIKRRAV